MPTQHITLYFDILSPFAYIAFHILEVRYSSPSPPSHSFLSLLLPT